VLHVHQASAACSRTIPRLSHLGRHRPCTLYGPPLACASPADSSSATTSPSFNDAHATPWHRPPCLAPRSATPSPVSGSLRQDHDAPGRCAGDPGRPGTRDVPRLGNWIRFGCRSVAAVPAFRESSPSVASIVVCRERSATLPHPKHVHWVFVRPPPSILSQLIEKSVVGDRSQGAPLTGLKLGRFQAFPATAVSYERMRTCEPPCQKESGSIHRNVSPHKRPWSKNRKKRTPRSTPSMTRQSPSLAGTPTQSLATQAIRPTNIPHSASGSRKGKVS